MLERDEAWKICVTFLALLARAGSPQPRASLLVTGRVNPDAPLRPRNRLVAARIPPNFR